jgi:glycosyltransferase involved in cell wall biosynthesis
MKLLLVYQDERLPSSRIRVLHMAPHLTGLGADCEVIPYPSSVGAKRGLWRRVQRADVVVLQYKLPSMIDGFLWRTVRRPIVFDFDDAIMFRHEPVGDSYESRTRRRRFARVAGFSHAFICGNEYLASFVRPTGKKVLVAASPVPVDVSRREFAADSEPLQVGWIGGRGNLNSLASLGDVFREMRRRHRFVLTVISDSDFDLEGCEVRNVRWSLETEGAELAKLDVGVMPLADTPWTRGKCGYKLLQYMAAEVPVVASPVGMNRTLVQHGMNGFLAASTDEWNDVLERLLADASLRQRIGKAGRRTVEQGYTYEHTARAWMGFLRDVAGSSSDRAA